MELCRQLQLVAITATLIVCILFRFAVFESETSVVVDMTSVHLYGVTMPGMIEEAEPEEHSASRRSEEAAVKQLAVGKRKTKSPSSRKVKDKNVEEETSMAKRRMKSSVVSEVEGVMDANEMMWKRHRGGGLDKVSGGAAWKGKEGKKEQAAPYGAEFGKGGKGRNCTTGRVFVYDLPERFNAQIVRECRSYNLIFCNKLRNWGLGAALTEQAVHDKEIVEELFGDLSCWYNTHMFTPEITYHARILQHPCRTENPEEATLFYVPYYAGLALERVIEIRNITLSDELPIALGEWLEQQPYVKRNGGHDHLLVLGSGGYDFFNTNSRWGCNLLIQPALKNMTKLSFDRNMWDATMTGIPYPTFFHPSTDNQLINWQERVRSANRRNLVAFVGSSKRASWYGFSKRSFDFRGILMKQCQEWDQCTVLNCKDLGDGRKSVCYSPVAPLRFYLDSHFCLQPKGDTPPRKSIFDAMVGGCIPVFFSRDSAYNQYHWYLPEDPETYSVYIDMDEVEAGNITIKDVLSRYTPQQILAMRNVVINDILPRIVVANPITYDMHNTRDAVDVAVEGMMVKIARYKAGLQHRFPNPWMMAHNRDTAYANLHPLPPPPLEQASNTSIQSQ